jgi:hypothetical protein
MTRQCGGKALMRDRPVERSIREPHGVPAMPGPSKKVMRIMRGGLWPRRGWRVASFLLSCVSADP